MGVTSFSFILFLLIVAVIYWFLPKGRTIFLLFASYCFYACYDIKSTFFLAFTTIITFYAGMLLERENLQQWVRKCIVIVVCSINVGVFVIFRYSVFFRLSGFQEIMRQFAIIVPLGISFYTFQAMGYILDVYSKRVKPCKQLHVYALYISFFPKIMQGPIENSHNFLTQLQRPRIFCYEKYLDALFICLVGFFKKLVLANRLAIVVNTVYNGLENYNGSACLLLFFILFKFIMIFQAIQTLPVAVQEYWGMI